MGKKVKDFEKSKLKVGKKKPEKSNATNTSFQAKSLVLKSQNRGPGLDTYLALVRHHQANTRRQALANVGEVMHLNQSMLGEVLRAVSPLMVDPDHQVRMGLAAFLGRVEPTVCAPYVPLLAVHVHAAMTHIVPGIRADSTRFLEIMLSTCPEEFVRRSFAKTLSLYFPLLGWSLEGKTQAGSVSSVLSLGKLAPKARASHLASLSKLLQCALSQGEPDTAVLYHPDTRAFVIPSVSSPFDAEIADDVVAREEALDGFREPLRRGLTSASKEGGETGRIAAKILAQVA